MCEVEHGVVWNAVSGYVECCIMQNVKLRCDVKCGAVELMKNVAYAMCCVMSDVENDAIYQMW